MRHSHGLQTVARFGPVVPNLPVTVTPTANVATASAAAYPATPAQAGNLLFPLLTCHCMPAQWSMDGGSEYPLSVAVVGPVLYRVNTGLP